MCTHGFRWAAGWTVAVSLWVSVCTLSNAADPPTSPSTSRPPIPFAKLAARYDLRPVADGPRWERLEVESLRWSNPVRRVDGGTVFLWCVSGRPRALVTLYTSTSGPPVIEHELSSLTDEPFAGTFDGQVVWKPADPGLRWRPVPGSPVPSNTRPGRLTQMRQISSGFEASHVKDESDRPGALRRLTAPIHRYPEQAGLDGAIFAFAQTTDPELVLLLEVAPATPGSTEGPKGYRYALARTSSYSMSVKYGDDIVWTAETWNWSTRHAGEPYTMTFSKEPEFFKDAAE
jgi:hypothetical protein